MQLLKLKIKPGQEVMSVLTKEFKDRQLTTGTITSIIGAIDSCQISNMPKHDPQEDIITDYEGPMELSGVGEIRDGLPHIHCTVSLEGDKAIHGHLYSATVQDWYVSAYVLVVDQYGD